MDYALSVGQRTARRGMYDQGWLPPFTEEQLRWRPRVETPMARLAVAMLALGVRDLFSPRATRRDSARQWMFGGGPAAALSFDLAADLVGIDPDVFRARLLWLLAHPVEAQRTVDDLCNLIGGGMRTERGEVEGLT